MNNGKADHNGNETEGAVDGIRPAALCDEFENMAASHGIYAKTGRAAL